MKFIFAQTCFTIKRSRSDRMLEGNFRSQECFTRRMYRKSVQANADADFIWHWLLIGIQSIVPHKTMLKSLVPGEVCEGLCVCGLTDVHHTQSVCHTLSLPNISAKLSQWQYTVQRTPLAARSKVISSLKTTFSRASLSATQHWNFTCQTLACNSCYRGWCPLASSASTDVPLSLPRPASAQPNSLF